MLNEFAALPRITRNEVRNRIISLYVEGKLMDEALIPLSEVKNHLPMDIGHFTDYYCSLEHTVNVSYGLAYEGSSEASPGGLGPLLFTKC